MIQIVLPSFVGQPLPTLRVKVGMISPTRVVTKYIFYACFNTMFPVQRVNIIYLTGVLISSRVVGTSKPITVGIIKLSRDVLVLTIVLAIVGISLVTIREGEHLPFSFEITLIVRR